MSGGFFRGTSADQDTRFSNKQAKLLKTQKFAPDLDHLVNMTKVKMDVMKPWIASRVTELLGFEDEVLINFVYGLLDGKVVDGKQIQIQLTGFMEKNTGKFMRELWGLLLSAQKNASGVPQQFLDEKEEEMRMMKVESDRITQEIQKRKEREGREPDHVKQRRMDGEVDITRHMDAASDADLQHSTRRVSSANPEEERELDERHDSRITSRQHSPSPHSDNGFQSIPRSSQTKSRSRSFSNLTSYSEDGRSKSRSISFSASPPRCSASQDWRSRSSPKHSVSPHQHHSPQIPQSSNRRLPYSRPRSSAYLYYGAPLPLHHRSPIRVRRRSPAPPPLRSPSPLRRLSLSPPPLRSPSPLHRRSPSPLRRRSPAPPCRRSPPRPCRQSPACRHHRSPSPSWHKAPLHHRSPIKLHRRSPSPARHRSSPRHWSRSPVRRRPLTPRRSPTHRRRSPLYSPKRCAVDLRSFPQQRNRNHNSHRSQSPLQNHRSVSRERNSHGDGGRTRWKRSPVQSFRWVDIEKLDLEHNRLDSPLEEQQDTRSAPVLPVPVEKHAKKSHSPSRTQDMNRSENWVYSSSKNPARQTREHRARYSSPGSSGGENSDAREGTLQKSSSSNQKSRYSPGGAGVKFSKRSGQEESSPQELAVKESVYVRGNQVNMKAVGCHKQRNMDHSEGCSKHLSNLTEEVEYGPGKAHGNFSPIGIDNGKSSSKQHFRSASSPDERPRSKKNLLGSSHSKEASHTDYRKMPVLEDSSRYGDKSRKKLDENRQASPADAGSDYNKIYGSQKSEKRSKKSEHKELSLEDEVGSDSAGEDRKEAKRRKEKRLRKEEKCRRREERHRKREEQRARKNAKYMDTVIPLPDYERNNNTTEDTDDDAGLRVSKMSDTEEIESEQKKLEIELRNKALESLRAKKAISH